MYSLKVIKDHHIREQEWDFRKILTGEFMALFANANSKTKFTRSDFFKLKHEVEQDEAVEERQLTKKEIKELLGSKFRRDGK